MRVFQDFIQSFANHALHVREVIFSLLLLIAFGGLAISKSEGLKLGDAVYFAFITALSIGYGDISPKTATGKVVSVGIGLLGMLFVGITVAIATRALAESMQRREGDH